MRVIRRSKLTSPIGTSVQTPIEAVERLEDALEKVPRKPKEGPGVPLGTALQIANAVMMIVGERFPDARLALAGSIRRRKDFCHDIDMIVCLPESEHEEARRYLSGPFSEKYCDRVLWEGPEKVSVIAGANTVVEWPAMQVDFRLVSPEHWGPSLQYFTGSRDHNIHMRARAKEKGLGVNEYGVFVRKPDGTFGPRIDNNTEKGVYRAVGMRWRPPEYRDE